MRSSSWRRLFHRLVVAPIVIALSGTLIAGAANSTSSSTNPPTKATASPNQALAEVAKEVLLKSLKPQYEKRENWGHQKEIVTGYQWRIIDGRWQAEKVTKKLNDGLWRMYRVTLDNASRNLQLRFSAPKAIENGRTEFTVFLTAKLGIEARQEQWTVGAKGLNFHLEGEATIAARLDVTIAVGPAKDAGFGAIEIQPVVTGVNLRLVDLTLRRLDLIRGDAARELGNAFEDILAGELHKREGEVMKKLNSEIEKHRDKLRVSPSQIAEIGWEKIQALLSTTSGAVKPAATSP